MKTRFWIPLSLMAVAIAAFLIACAGPRRAESVERTAMAEIGSLEVYVTGTGKVGPEVQAALLFKVAGTLGKLNVEVGQLARAGQVLAELDPASLDPSLVAAEADLIAAQQALADLMEGPTDQQLAQAELAAAQARDALRIAEYRWNVQQAGHRASSSTIRGAEAGLVLAEQELEQAKANYDQFSGLSSDNPVRALALTELVAAEQARDAALRNLNWYTGRPTEIQQAILDAEVAAASANVKQAEQDLADLQAGPDPDAVEVAEVRVQAAQAVVDQARLIAPIDGTVMSINHRPGDSIVPGEVEIVIADLSTLHVDTMVDELDIALLAMDQQVEITLDAVPDLILGGWVAGIDLAPAAGTAQYPVRVELDSAEEQVRVGMTAALSILVARQEQTLLIPNWALGIAPETGDVIVTVYNGEAREVRVVTLGLRNDTFSEVLSGLEPGETVGVTIVEEPQGPGGGFFGPG